MKKKSIVTTLICVIVLCSGCGGNSKKAISITTEKTTTTTLPSIDKENAKLMSVLPALADMEAGLSESYRKVITPADAGPEEACPGTKRASIQVPPITRVSVRFTRSSSSALIYDAVEADITVDAFSSEKTAQKFIDTINTVIVACAPNTSDLGDGYTENSIISAPGKVSQADKKLGITDPIFSNGNQVATDYEVVASKGRYVVETTMDTANDAESQANTVLAKL